ncbi:ATP-binding protein [Streptomyces sp. NPDC047014]|uniref:ATP-binding protein n=1 Tax=Streptomyces sp. NPDC047014 TaxID=3155736 RepID=UPI00340C8C14
MELHALPSRIGQIRRIVSSQLRHWQLDPLIDRAALGVTELLSNVHRHARPDTTCVVEIELRLGRVTVSVLDGDPRLPVLRSAPPGALETCGRGLALVAALSEAWGVRLRADGCGKAVWFSLTAPPVGAPQPALTRIMTTPVRDPAQPLLVGGGAVPVAGPTAVPVAGPTAVPAGLPDALPAGVPLGVPAGAQAGLPEAAPAGLQPG